MPTISMQSGKMSKDTKKLLIEKLTSAASEVTSIPEDAFTVFLDEYDFDAIGVGGRQFSEREKK